MEKINIKRFGEKRLDGNYTGFVEYEDGSRENCTEGEIASLWNDWVKSGRGVREDKDGYTIFRYK